MSGDSCYYTPTWSNSVISFELGSGKYCRITITNHRNHELDAVYVRGQAYAEPAIKAMAHMLNSEWQAHEANWYFQEIAVALHGIEDAVLKAGSSGP